MTENENTIPAGHDTAGKDDLLHEVLQGIDRAVDSITDTEIETRLQQLLDGPQPAGDIARNLVSGMKTGDDTTREGEWITLYLSHADRETDSVIAFRAASEHAAWKATVARVQADRLMADARRHLDHARSYRDDAVERAGEIVSEAQGRAAQMIAGAEAQVADSMARAQQILSDASRLAHLVMADAEQAVTSTATGHGPGDGANQSRPAFLERVGRTDSVCEWGVGRQLLHALAVKPRSAMRSLVVLAACGYDGLRVDRAQQMSAVVDHYRDVVSSFVAIEGGTDGPRADSERQVDVVHIVSRGAAVVPALDLCSGHSPHQALIELKSSIQDRPRHRRTEQTQIEEESAMRAH